MQNFLQTVPEWSNDSRCSALFSALPKTPNHNPKAYRDKFEFWKKILLQTSKNNLLQSELQHNGSLNNYFLMGSVDGGRKSSKARKRSSLASIDTSFLLDNSSSVAPKNDMASCLERIFQRNGLTPKCLRRILLQLLEEKTDFISFDEFMNRKFNHDISWSSWFVESAFSAVSLTAKWGLERFGGYVSSSATDQNQTVPNIVILPLVEEVANEVLKRLSNQTFYTDAIMSFENLSRVIDDGDISRPLTDVDKKILLKYLESEGYVRVEMHKHDDKEVLILKFRSQDDLNLKAKNLQLSEADRGIFIIKHTIQKIESQLDTMEIKSSEYLSKAKSFNKQKLKSKAIAQLKLYKQIEAVISKRSTALQNLQAILLQIQQKQSDSEVLSAMKSGADALSSIMKLNELNIDKVDETMDRIQEVMADQREIDFALEQGQKSIRNESEFLSGIDEDQLEKELDGLMEKETLKPNQKSQATELENLNTELRLLQIESLPSVPTESNEPDKEKLPVLEGS